MNTNTLEQFTMMDEMVLSSIEGGKCTWSGLGKAAIGTGAGNGLRMGIKTGTWQGAIGGAAGGAIIGGVGYGATCWW
ncbi:Blp family class II bacteriocin [Streptococcus thoraltensis]|uniref:Blp family class II bacteriocin n=1 Tax=Streptococcus thoraltensis TaxID=55085 RepID=UPI0003708527|nr:Blp family class II bacteriocin [Streptococcus thoraltensis]MDY4760522.1 Blp family class II bacteriocin [Streptococcus thoraltensis]